MARLPESWAKRLSELDHETHRAWVAYDPDVEVPELLGVPPVPPPPIGSTTALPPQAAMVTRVFRPAASAIGGGRNRTRRPGAPGRPARS